MSDVIRFHDNKHSCLVHYVYSLCIYVVISVMRENSLYLTKQARNLQPGRMSDHHFWLLAEISPLHSEKVINALRDFLVLGYTRREACERHSVSQGYFSGALGRFYRVSQTVHRLVPFYISEAAVPYMG